MPEPLGRGLEEFLLRPRQHLAAGRLELRDQVLARLPHQLELLVEALGIGLERRVLDLRIAELLDRALELFLALGAATRAEEPADKYAEYQRDTDQDQFCSHHTLRPQIGGGSAPAALLLDLLSGVPPHVICLCLLLG